MYVLSREPLSDGDVKKIEQILVESNCPHESFTNTFERYTGIVDDAITFDGVNPRDYVKPHETPSPPD